MFSVLRHNGNANQNDTESPAHPSQNGNYQENKQQQILVRMPGVGWGKAPLSTVGRNVNYCSQYKGSSKNEI
jgi:hypothetical protein